MIFKAASTQIGQCLENKFCKGLKPVNTSCSTPVSVSGSGCYRLGWVTRLYYSDTELGFSPIQ